MYTIYSHEVYHPKNAATQVSSLKRKHEASSSPNRCQRHLQWDKVHVISLRITSSKPSMLLNDTYMRVMYANAHRSFQNKTDLAPYHIKRQYQDSGRFEELKLTIFDTFSQRWVHPTALF
jgi:hypothetical protein